MREAVICFTTGLLVLVGGTIASFAQNSSSGIVPVCARTDPPVEAFAGPGRKLSPLVKGGMSLDADLEKPVVPYINRGMGFLRTEDLDRALDEFNQAIKVDPLSSIAFLGRARTHLAKHKYDLAIKDADQAIKLFPRNAAAHYVLGTTYMRTRDLGRALANLDRAIDLEPACGLMFLTRGDAYLIKGDYDRAAEDFKRVIDLDAAPTLLPNLLWRANAYGRVREYEKAMSDLSKAEKLAPGDALVYYSRCVIRIVIDALDEASKDCDTALRIKPLFARALDSRAIILLRKSAFDDAIASFDAAHRLDSALPYSLFGRGVAKRKKGDTRGGDADIAAARAMHPHIAVEMARYGVKE